MYVTRPLSLYRKFPDSLSLPPPEGPNSGILVVQDEESETTTCFGLCKDREIRSLPIPQNKAITIRYSSGAGENEHVSYYYVMLIPVLNQPLSSNRYYITQTHRTKHRGEAYTCSKEEDMSTGCCGNSIIRDVKSRPLDRRDIYQQFEICLCEPSCGSPRGFYARSVASDGFPPRFLRRKGWKVSTKTPKNYELGEAAGLDATLRARLPDFNFPLSCIHSETTVVGKWYIPFMFIKEGKLKDQSKSSAYYEMTIEQYWEQIFACEKNHGEGNAAVTVDAAVQTEEVFVGGTKALHDENNVVDGVTWFRSPEIVGGDTSVGIDLAIIERMKWEQERVGWIHGSNGQVNVKRTEEFGGMGEWTKFGCYILVERFVLKRMDGSLVLSFEYKHTHQINSKWE